MNGVLWGAFAVVSALACFCAFYAGKRGERARLLREELTAYEKMEKIRARVGGLPVDVLLGVLRGSAHKK